MRMNRTIMLALAAGMFAGCTGALSEDPVGPGSETTLLEVENHNWADATIYVVSGATRMRLGSVITSDSRQFRLPAGVVNGRGQVRFLVDLLGSRTTYLTPRIQVMPGDRVRFTVQNHLPLSSFMVTASRD